jgi:hypothetical protein
VAIHLMRMTAFPMSCWSHFKSQIEKLSKWQFEHISILNLLSIIQWIKIILKERYFVKKFFFPFYSSANVNFFQYYISFLMNDIRNSLKNQENAMSLNNWVIHRLQLSLKWLKNNSSLHLSTNSNFNP